MMDTHYSKKEWRRYRQNLVSEDVREAMEEHLGSCEECSAVYLSLIDQREEELALVFLPVDFSRQTARLATGEKPTRGVALRNYAIAAALTLFLLSSGWFGVLSRRIPPALFSLTHEETSRVVSAPRWYNEITEEVSRWVRNIVNPDK